MKLSFILNRTLTLILFLQEITRIGPQLLIDVAKKRGLFPEAGKRSKIKIREYRPPSPKPCHIKPDKRIEKLLLRINAPTQSSLWREKVTKTILECRKKRSSTRFPSVFLGQVCRPSVTSVTGFTCARHVHHHCLKESDLPTSQFKVGVREMEHWLRPCKKVNVDDYYSKEETEYRHCPITEIIFRHPDFANTLSEIEREYALRHARRHIWHRNTYPVHVSVVKF